MSLFCRLTRCLAPPSEPPTLLTPDQRSADLTIDAIRTITRAKVTRDSLAMVMSGYARDIAEAKTPAQRGLLDEAQVQATANKLLSPAASQQRSVTALQSCGSNNYYHNVLDHIVVLFLSRMGVDQASRQAVAALSDLFVARMRMFAQAMQREVEGNSVRPPEDIFTEALSVFGVASPAELVPWYELNVVQYAEQMLQSEMTLKQRIVQVDAERQKRQEGLTQFLSKHAHEGSELATVHREMNNAQMAMQAAQKQYYESKGKNPSLMQMASAAYQKAQEAFKKHAKFIQVIQRRGARCCVSVSHAMRLRRTRRPNTRRVRRASRSGCRVPEGSQRPARPASRCRSKRLCSSRRRCL